MDFYYTLLFIYLWIDWLYDNSSIKNIKLLLAILSTPTFLYKIYNLLRLGNLIPYYLLNNTFNILFPGLLEYSYYNFYNDDNLNFINKLISKITYCDNGLINIHNEEEYNIIEFNNYKNNVSNCNFEDFKDKRIGKFIMHYEDSKTIYDKGIVYLLLKELKTSNNSFYEIKIKRKEYIFETKLNKVFFKNFSRNLIKLVSDIFGKLKWFFSITVLHKIREPPKFHYEEVYKVVELVKFSDFNFDDTYVWIGKSLSIINLDFLWENFRLNDNEFPYENDVFYKIEKYYNIYKYKPEDKVVVALKCRDEPEIIP